MTKKLVEKSFVFILLIPLLFINVKSSHDWGDDFAQYLHQSQNLINGISQNETGVIFNESHFIGPVAYPVGFPLILAPVLKTFGYNIPALTTYLSLFLVLSCLVGFVFLRRQFSFKTSVLATLIIAYNPILLSLKTEILSDLPYLFFSMLSLLLITNTKQNVTKHLLLGLLIAISVHIRTVGFLLLFIYLLSILQTWFEKRMFAKDDIQRISVGLSGFLLLYLVLKFSFPCNTNYPFPLELDNFWENMNTHLTYNLDNLFAFFRKYNGSPYGYLGIMGACALITFSIIGLLQTWRTNKKDLANYYVSGYILLIVCLKFGDAGFRFILPILFFIFLYAIIGLSLTMEGMKMNKKWFSVVFAVLIFISYKEEFNTISRTEKEITEGPEKPDAKKMFDFINTNLKESDIIEFEKPRVISFYTKARSIAIKPVQHEADLKNDILKFKVNYVLVHYILTDVPIKQLIANNPNNYVSVYKLNDLELFKVN